ncbi:hypothetical protein C8F04DRAFT_1181542 [Mycena alexandri]|uniref:Uncharacterized protein n=1 Tax=Mycena alexandri TaxID=1745969 RepID=A0AAD6X612_9AGAR|nr:hypothetical protein C8F04DRAFT_1181542 [Mycena alexandri]
MDAKSSGLRLLDQPSLIRIGSLASRSFRVLLECFKPLESSQFKPARNLNSTNENSTGNIKLAEWMEGHAAYLTGTEKGKEGMGVRLENGQQPIRRGCRVRRTGTIATQTRPAPRMHACGMAAVSTKTQCTRAASSRRVRVRADGTWCLVTGALDSGASAGAGALCSGVRRAGRCGTREMASIGPGYSPRVGVDESEVWMESEGEGDGDGDGWRGSPWWRTHQQALEGTIGSTAGACERLRRRGQYIHPKGMWDDQPIELITVHHPCEWR